MDRSPYYADHSRAGSLNRAFGSGSREEHEARRNSDRLPPLLPSSQSLPSARPEGLPSRLVPIQSPATGAGAASSAAATPYASHRFYPPGSDRSTASFDIARRPASPSSIPVGMVSSAGYMHSRRSPSEVTAASYPTSSSSSYRPPHHVHHPDSYRQDALRAQHQVPHAPHHRHQYNPQPPPPLYQSHTADNEPISAATPVKRPRVSLACLACRNRKSRCDGIRPTCKTCTNMKIDCKWPEVDFRRAKTGDAARARKRSPPGTSTQQSPESVDLRHPAGFDAATDHAYRPTSGGALPASHSMPSASFAPAPLPLADPQDSSPTLDRGNRYRTHSDGGQRALYTETAPVPADHSPREQYMHPYPQERLADAHARTGALPHLYSSAALTDGHHRQEARMRDDVRAPSYPQEHRAAAWDDRASRPTRALPEARTVQRDRAAVKCRDRAAQIAILARPATDAQRIAVEAHMSAEGNLDDLADQATAGERLDTAFSANWDAIGGLSPAAQRPFMDVAAGIVAVLEMSDIDAQRGPDRPSSDPVGRLHMFRLRHGPTSNPPDLRHVSVALALSTAERRELLEITSSPYNTLSYPIPVDRLSRPLPDVISRIPEKEADEHVKADTAGIVSTKTASRVSRAPSDSIPILLKDEIKPSRATIELFLQAYIVAIGDQMPGLDTGVVAARIRDGSISALLANALCSIGASLYERRGQRPAITATLSSKEYGERARALLGAALQSPDVEVILALGVMAIRDILMGQMISAAVLVSSAVRLCMQLDLHRARMSGSDVEKREEGTDLDADDVFWMTYCLDRITSIATARPLVIKDHDINTSFPSAMRNGEPCIFSALVRQLHYLGRLLDVAVTSSSTASERARDLEIATVETDLINHYDSLPASLRLSATNLRRAHENREPLSYLQLHLTHNMAMLHRFLLSQSRVEYGPMRRAASSVVEICKLAETVDATLLADTPLSAIACFLAGCVLLAEMEEWGPDGRQGEATRSEWEKVTSTLMRHAEFWPVAGSLVDVLHAQKARSSMAVLKEETVRALAEQVEAVHIIVRRPGGEEDETGPQRAVTVRKVDDLEHVRGAFPHLC